MINSVAPLHAFAFSPSPARDAAPARSVDGENDSQVPALRQSETAADPAATGGGSESEFSVADLRQIAALQATDRQVRTHELAHMAAGSGLTGGASFTYQVGPDRQRYAVGGEVSIDISPADDPKATIAKALQIRAAALAPADPSPQDQKVAALAAQMASVARLELATRERAASSAEGSADSRQAIARRPGVAAAAAYQSVADGERATGFRALA